MPHTLGVAMSLNVFDIVVFLGFIIAVITVGILMSREEKDSEGYFLAGRGLSWWLIGFSLIAANISTEQFVGMSGQAANYVGIAIASYEWMAAITLVVVAFFFLPKFLQTGIYTIPEFLEYRYNELSRSIMAGFTMIIYVFVTIAAVIFSGAIVIDTLFRGAVVFGVPINVTSSAWIIGVIAAVYVMSGGLKACAWADLLQGSALIIGGGIITYLAFDLLGSTPVGELAAGGAAAGKDLADSASGIDKFLALNSDKLHMVLPMNDEILPWTALVVGLWIPNFYYWGLNQYITQRTLASKSLAEGQKGAVFAAALKLIIPFVIVFPGIVAFNLYGVHMAQKAGQDAQILQEWARFEKLSETPGQPNEDGQYVLFVMDRQAVDGAVPQHKAQQLVDQLEKEIRELSDRNSGPQEAEMQQATIAGKTQVIAHLENRVMQPENVAREVKAYNQATRAAAEQAGAPTTTKQLYLCKYDSAFALLIRELVPQGLRGFVLAAILGAVVSSLASMLNSASTIFTMDLFNKYIDKEASQTTLVLVGRICVGIFVVIGCVIAPLLADPQFKGIFSYIQEFQGFISPGILAVFVFGFVVRRAPGVCGVLGLILNPFIYGVLKLFFPQLAFLDRMAISFGVLLGIMGIITYLKPLSEPVKLPTVTDIDLSSAITAKVGGAAVVIATVVLYIIFW
ncbi:MAG: sodium:solute symporter family transporter [Planctomycetota bacterium]